MFYGHYSIDGEAMCKFVLLLALTASLFAPPAMAQGKTSKPSALPPPPPHLTGTCANCHGTEGKGIGAIPALAGKDNQYLREQLNLFKTGQRPASVMNQLAKGYSDEELAFLAEYYSKKK
jgi:cytochrome subunit of sulfide dehydrogenase